GKEQQPEHEPEDEPQEEQRKGQERRHHQGHRHQSQHRLSSRPPRTRSAGAHIDVRSEAPPGSPQRTSNTATSGGAHVRKGTRLPPTPRETKSVVPSTSWRPHG